MLPSQSFERKSAMGTGGEGDVLALDALRSGAMAGTRELRLAGLGLTELPREVFGLADTLEVLDLSGNALTALPDDFARLTRLRVLFASGNRFARLPPVLGACPALSQIGFRGSGLREIPAEALPPRLRWLTLTDNALKSVPDALGARPFLQKLMLAGNQLTHLPESLAGAPRLELLRLSANAFAALPPWLPDMPRLAWLAWAGNPGANRSAAPLGADAAWSALALGRCLGEGASGQVHEAVWRQPARSLPVAVKLFKGAMTSDGLPACEMEACLAAGDHPALLGGLARITGHPAGAQGLVVPLLPGHWRALAAPPSLETCSRDVYAPAARWSLDTLLRLAGAIGGAAAHLHGRGMLHGDLYAHNVLWDGCDGAAVLSDFGAASFMPEAESGRLARLDVLAWGLLLGELLGRCSEAVPLDLVLLQQACAQRQPASRPSMAEAVRALPPSS